MVANKATTITTQTAQKFHSIYMFSYGMCQQGRACGQQKTVHEQNPPVINAG